MIGDLSYELLAVLYGFILSISSCWQERSSPIIDESRELLPDPIAPIMQMNSPFFILKFMFLRATDNFPYYSFELRSSFFAYLSFFSYFLIYLEFLLSNISECFSSYLFFASSNPQWKFE